MEYLVYNIYLTGIGDNRYTVHRKGPNDSTRVLLPQISFELSNKVVGTSELKLRTAISAQVGSARFLSKLKGNKNQKNKKKGITYEEIDKYGTEVSSILIPTAEAVRLDTVYKTKGVGTHFRLHLTDAQLLREVNWESMHLQNSEQKIDLQFSTDPEIALSRVFSPNVARKKFPKNVEKFRILLIVATPENLPKVGALKEITEIYSHLEKGSPALDNYEFDKVLGATRSKIGDKISEFKPHIIHYIGHSDYHDRKSISDDKDGKGSVYLHDSLNSRKYDKVSDEVFKTLLVHQDLFVVILNSCQSSVGGIRKSNPYSGLAERLIKAKVPYVVAMQNLISVPAAISFSKGFYSVFFENGSIFEAVTNGRLNIFKSDENVEFATPVLYTSDPPPKLKLHINHVPVAEIDVEQTLVTSGHLVTLDGSKSYDDDKEDILTYKWEYRGGGPKDLDWTEETWATSASPAFTAPETSDELILNFRLIVHDGKVSSIPKDIEIKVTPKIVDRQNDERLEVNVILPIEEAVFGQKFNTILGNINLIISIFGALGISAAIASYHLKDIFLFLFCALVLVGIFILWWNSRHNVRSSPTRAMDGTEDVPVAPPATTIPKPVAAAPVAAAPAAAASAAKGRGLGFLKWLIPLLLLLLLALFGLKNCKPTPPAPVIIPVVSCWDGSEAETRAACPTKVTCWDGSDVKNASACPAEPAPTYTCWDGSEVEPLSSCPAVPAPEPEPAPEPVTIFAEPTGGNFSRICGPSSNVLFDVPNYSPKTVAYLGSNPQYGNSHGYTSDQFYEMLVDAHQSGGMDQAFLNLMARSLGYSHFQDMSAANFTEDTLPNGSKGLMGFSKSHALQYSRLQVDSPRDLEAFRVRGANGTDVHIMKTCGNYMYVCN